MVLVGQFAWNRLTVARITMSCACLFQSSRTTAFSSATSEMLPVAHSVLPGALHEGQINSRGLERGAAFRVSNLMAVLILAPHEWQVTAELEYKIKFGVFIVLNP